MGLFDRIKSLLGLGDSSEGRPPSDPSVTVEREPRSGVDATSEAAVKEPVDADTGPAEATEDEPAEGQGTEADVIADAEPTAEQAETGGDGEPAAETAADSAAPADEVVVEEAEEVANVEPESEEETEAEDESEAEPADEDESESEAASEPAGEDESEVDEAADVADGETDLQEVRGIGPAYAGRLEEAGITTAEELAAADPAELAERIGVSEKQTEKWVDRAAE